MNWKKITMVILGSVIELIFIPYHYGVKYIGTTPDNHHKSDYIWFLESSNYEVMSINNISNDVIYAFMVKRVEEKELLF